MEKEYKNMKAKGFSDNDIVKAYHHIKRKSSGNEENSELSIDLNKGFKMKFHNGYEISVQFGSINLCHNRNDEKIEEMESELQKMHYYGTSSNDAEVAIFRPNGEWVTLVKYEYSSDEVKGYMSSDEVGNLIGIVKDLDGDTEELIIGD